MPNAKEFESDSESERTRSDDTWSMSQGLVADLKRLVKFPRAQRDYLVCGGVRAQCHRNGGRA